MADNYLEKRMEQHRNGGDVPSRRMRLTPKGDKPGCLTVKYEPLRVLVACCEDAYGEAIVRRLSSVGCKVAFVASDNKAGRELSQSTSSRFYPAQNFDYKAAMADATKAWGGIDMLISDEMPSEFACRRIVIVDARPVMPEVGDVDVMINAVSTCGVSPEDLSQFVLYLSLPSSKFIKNKVFRF